MQKSINTLAELEAEASALSQLIKPGDLVFLKGDLGAGKTTFAQYFLKACGVKEHVKSPTYTLYESYEVAGQVYYHMDLYRLTDPEELYFLGIEDIVNQQHTVLVEWPDKGAGVLPVPDCVIDFQLNHLNRTLTITLK